MKWFGESWGAGICDRKDHVPTPVGAMCEVCEKDIEEGDQGFRMGQLHEDGALTYGTWHLDCFLKHFGIRPTGKS